MKQGRRDYLRRIVHKMSYYPRRDEVVALLNECDWLEAQLEEAKSTIGEQVPIKPQTLTTSIFRVRDGLLPHIRSHLLWLGDDVVEGVPSGLVLFDQPTDVNPVIVVMRPQQDGGLWEWFQLVHEKDAPGMSSFIENSESEAIVGQLVIAMRLVRERRTRNAV